MKTCAACNVQFNDGVQCGSCRKHLDFVCANISETGWRKLGANRMAQWKCPTCRTSSPAAPSAPAATAAPATEPVSLETVLNEIRGMKRQLTSLPTLVDDIRLIKDELSEVRLTCEATNGKFEEIGSRLAEVEAKVSELEKLHNTVNSLQSDLAKAKFEISAHDQRSRLNNIEIKGVPVGKDENLFSVVEAIGRKVNYNFSKTHINYISRVPIFKSSEKLIIVSFLNRYVKEDFIAAARAVKNLSTADIGCQGTSTRVYINDHLSVEHKKLLSRVKILAKEKHYEYVWVKHGKIHLLKNNHSKVYIIKNELDLNKII